MRAPRGTWKSGGVAVTRGRLTCRRPRCSTCVEVRVEAGGREGERVTELDWLHSGAHLQWLLMHLCERKMPRSKVGRRKLRLLACGCCRGIWPLLADERLRDAVLVADGGASKADLAAAFESVAWTAADSATPQGTPRSARAARDMAIATCRPQPYAAAFAMTCFPHYLPDSEPLARSLVRCLFGNPFRPAAADPAWRTSTALGLAAAIYEAQAFHDLPVLADALEDAGCDDELVLGHCRGGGPHARGCWVVDAVLDR